MGCSQSKMNKQRAVGLYVQEGNKAMMTLQWPCDAAAVADLPDEVVSSTRVVEAAQATSIQDLPPLLLAHIFSKHLSWEELQGPVSLVCQTWRRVAAEVTPQQLSFEFDLVQDDSPSTEPKAEAKTLLQMLLSQPSKLLQRITGQLRPQQLGEGNEAEQQPEGPAHDAAGSAADLLQQQQFLQYQQNRPWQQWLQQHGMQLQDFSVSITNLDTNCAAAQCQLKETLLKALADSATPTPALSASSSFVSNTTSSSSSIASHRISDSSKSDSSTSDCSSSSAPDTPLSSSCSEFSEASSSSDTSSSTSSSSSKSTLQLKSLHLKVPLFECDVLLLAHGICARAPELKVLSLVGYSSSGAVKTRNTTILSSSSSSGTSRHRLPITLPSSRRSSLSGGQTLAEAAAAAAAAGSNAPPRGGDLIPVGYADPTGTGTPPWAPSPSSGRGGFITGSSLKQLMSSVPQLESLTFACRQLYKLNWLAPATQLTYLSLRDCSLGGDLVKQLAGLTLPKLRGLDLSGSRGLGGPQLEPHLQQLTRVAGGQLQQLDLSGWDLSSSSSRRELPHLANLRQLAELKLECCGLKGWAVPAGQLPSLTHLSLSGNPLDSKGVAAACAMSQLRVLELAHVAPREVALLPQQLPGEGPACWAGMQAMPHLTSLNLAGNYWPDSSLPDRSPLLAYRAFKHTLCSSIAGSTSLARIDLTACKAPCFRITHLLANLPTSVTEVILDRVGDGVKRADLEALQALPQLRVLSACGSGVRDKHAGALSGLEGLQSLVLRDNALGPEGLVELLEGLGSQLTLLDVTGNERLRRRGGSGVAASSSSSCSSGFSSSFGSSSCSGASSSACVGYVHSQCSSHLALLRD